jgi:hypothetical protein
MKCSDFFTIFFFSFGEAGFPSFFSHENKQNIMDAMDAEIPASPLEQRSYATDTFANFPTIPQDKKPFAILADLSNEEDFAGWAGEIQLSCPNAVIIPVRFDRFTDPCMPKPLPDANIIGLHYGYARENGLNTAPTAAVRRLIAFTLEIQGYNRKDRQFQNYGFMTMRAIANYMNLRCFNNEGNPRKNALPPYQRSFHDDPVIPKEFWR